MLLLGLAGIGLAVALALYGVMSQAQERALVRTSLRQLEGYEVGNLREQELLASLRQRAVSPMLGRVLGLTKRFTPVGYVDRVRQRFVRAGQPEPDAVDRFLAMRVATLVIGSVVLGYVWLLSGIGGMMRLALTVFLAILLFKGPDIVLDRKVTERQLEIRKRLPDVLDLLVISVEAGLGFEQAVDRVIAAVPGPLTDELARMLGEIRAGSSRGDALRALDRRVDLAELRSFVMAVLQADTFGVSIGRILRSQADEMRIKRRQFAQERAMKAPVKMLIPMVFCIFPALFVITLGPAMLNIMKNLK